LAGIVVDLYLYGDLARYAYKTTGYGSANLKVALEGRSVVRDLLAQLRIPTEERGVTFINGNLSAMPGLQPDLGHVLKDGDRVAFFDLKSMWPFQYRNGAKMIDEMARALSTERDKGLHHTYDTQ
jgi:hypothetical protein